MTQLYGTECGTVLNRMEKYTAAPFCDDLQAHDASLGHAVTERLVFIEPQTSTAFDFRKHKVTRTALPISHGRVLTSPACQGPTMPLGVIIDAGCKDEADRDNLWLHLYVMLSRATAANDLLLIRAPPASFLAQGPPADLAAKLRTFTARTQACRETAERLAWKLGDVSACKFAKRFYANMFAVEDAGSSPQCSYWPQRFSIGPHMS